MASNTRTFNLNIGGVSTAITSISQLESAVQTLDQQLATAQFGTQQFTDLQQQAQRARQALAAVQAQTSGTTQATAQAGQAAQQMGGQFQNAFGIANLAGGQTGQVLGRLQGSLGSLQGGIGTISKGFGTLRGAIASTGIGLLVLAFGALVTYFTQTQAGMDFISRKTAALQAVFGLLTQKVASVGKSIFEAFSNPKKAIADLVQFIETNLLNRLKSFSVILDGIVNKDFGKITDGFIQMGTGITDATAKAKNLDNSFTQLGEQALAAAKAGEAIASSNQQIAREERELNIQRAEANAQLTKLKLISDDSTKSIKTRTAATQAAFAIEKPLIDRQLALQDRKIANQIREMNLDGQKTAAELDALAELRTKRAEVQKESFDKQAELTAKLSGFITQQAATEQAARDKKKAADEKASADLKALREKENADVDAAQSLFLDTAKKGLERRLALERAGTPEFLRIQKDLLNLDQAAQLEAIDQKYEKAGTKEKAALLRQKKDVVEAGIQAEAKLESDNQKAKLVIAATNEKELADIHLIGLREGTQAYYDALLKQVDAEEQLALANLDTTKDNENAKTAITKKAVADRRAIALEAQKPFNLGTSVLKEIFGVSDEEIGQTKDAIDAMTGYALQATTSLLASLSEARLKALDAQLTETQNIIDAAKTASDDLKSQLDESQTRIDELEGKLGNAKGLERQKIIDHLVEERKRNAAIAADKKKEDDRIKAAEAQKIALEQKKTKEQEKQQQLQQVMNALQAISAAIGATEAAVTSVKAIAAAGAGGKFGFDNVAYILAATAAIAGAFVAVKSASKGFAEGGFTGEGSGSQDHTGFKVAGVVHENEYVVPKWMVTSPKYSSTIAQLESARVSGGAGFAQGGYAPVNVPQPQAGIDMSILMGMQAELISLRQDTNSALNKPVYVSHDEYRRHDTKTAEIREYFVA